MKTHTSERIAQTMANPATSHWLKGALTQAIQRDPVDALADAQHLALLLRSRLEDIMGTHGEANAAAR